SKKLIKNVLKKEGFFDIIHAHYLPNIRIAVKIKELIGIPVVGTEHWSELKKQRIKLSVRKDAEESYPKADQLITVSHPMRKIVRSTFGIDSVFVGCVIDSVFRYIPKTNDGVFRFL